MKWAEHFRRAKSEWRSAIPSGPLGPGFAKIRAWCGSTTAPGFSQPTLPVRFHRRAAFGRPQARTARPYARPGVFWLFCRGGACSSRPSPPLILSRPLGTLKVNWPKGPKKGGLGHWLLSGQPESNPPGRRNFSASDFIVSEHLISPKPSGGTLHEAYHRTKTKS